MQLAPFTPAEVNRLLQSNDAGQDSSAAQFQSGAATQDNLA